MTEVLEPGARVLHWAEWPNYKTKQKYTKKSTTTVYTTGKKEEGHKKELRLQGKVRAPAY